MQRLDDFERLTENLIVASQDEATRADPYVIVDGSRYSYFRACPGNLSVFIRNGAPAELSLEDIEALNARCDDREKPRNRKVKKNVVNSLTRYFGEAAFHVYEFGCGKFPISKYFGSRSGISYHGIERDRNHIVELHKMNIPASDWGAAMKSPAPKDRPSICTAIYALHFMVNNKLPRRIRTLSNEQGFFVGNFYIDPNEAQNNVARGKLGDILERDDMSFITIDDPGSRANQYWVIGSSGSVTNIHRYAAVLEKTLLESENVSIRHGQDHQPKGVTKAVKDGALRQPTVQARNPGKP